MLWISRQEAIPRPLTEKPAARGRQQARNDKSRESGEGFSHGARE